MSSFSVSISMHRSQVVVSRYGCMSVQFYVGQLKVVAVWPNSSLSFSSIKFSLAATSALVMAVPGGSKLTLPTCVKSASTVLVRSVADSSVLT